MTTDKNVNAGTRLGSMILDHLFMTMIAMLFFIPLMIKEFSEAFEISHQQKYPGDFSGPAYYVMLIGFVLYFCKDCVNGRSIAKRIIKLQVVDNSTGAVASPLKCFVRNIFCIIWPIEVIVTLINPGRRIGDRVAGTRIVYYDPALTEQPKIDIKKILVTVAISFVFLVLLMLPFQSFHSSTTKVKYIESSYNAAASKALEKLYRDSLGQYLSASVRVYNKIENQQLKYISVIYQLKENYLDDENNSGELKRLTMQHLYTLFPENTFTGYAQYVYQAGGSMQTSSNSIGKQISITTRP